MTDGDLSVNRVVFRDENSRILRSDVIITAEAPIVNINNFSLI